MRIAELKNLSIMPGKRRKRITAALFPGAPARSPIAISRRARLPISASSSVFSRSGRRSCTAPSPCDQSGQCPGNRTRGGLAAPCSCPRSLPGDLAGHLRRQAPNRVELAFAAGTRRLSIEVARDAGHAGIEPPAALLGVSRRSRQTPTTWSIQRRSRPHRARGTARQGPRERSPSPTGIDSPAEPSSIDMQCEGRFDDLHVLFGYVLCAAIPVVVRVVVSVGRGGGTGRSPRRSRASNSFTRPSSGLRRGDAADAVDDARSRSRLPAPVGDVGDGETATSGSEVCGRSHWLAVVRRVCTSRARSLSRAIVASRTGVRLSATAAVAYATLRYPHSRGPVAQLVRSSRLIIGCSSQSAGLGESTHRGSPGP